MQDPSRSCDSLRAEFVTLLYGELQGTERRLVEEHLLGCSSCREYFDSLRATQDDLSFWEGPTLGLLEADSTPRELTDEVTRLTRAGEVPERLPSPPRRAQPRPALRLLAAAAALLVALSLLGTRLELRKGSLLVTFHLPGVTPTRGDAGQDLDILTPTLRRIAAEEAAQEFVGQNEALRLELAELVMTFADREESRRRELANLLERMRLEDQQSLLELAQLVDSSRQESRRANHQSREAIVELARVILPTDAPRAND